MDGFMPLSPRKLRTLWGVGAPIYLASTSNPGLTVVCFYTYNIGVNPFAIVFLSDGSAVQVNTQTGSTLQVLTAGTIASPSITNLGVSQYGSQYLLIVANQPNGYWVWDGATIYTAGSLGPVVTMTNVGSGYTTQPTMTVSGGQGSGATFNAVIGSSGQITNIQVTNAGAGWLGTDTGGASGDVQLTISGGNQAGNGAALVVNQLVKIPGGSGGAINLTFTFQSGTTYNYKLTGVSIAAGGHGYSKVVKAVISGGTQQAGGTGVLWAGGASPPTVTLGTTNGVITSVSVSANPSQWITLSTAALTFPAVTISDAGYWTISIPSNVTVSNGGTNYGPNAKIKATGGSATKQAQLVPVLGAGSAIVGVTITDGGIYTTSAVPTLTVTDSITNATATLTLMPFGIQGTAVQTYAGHVWVFNGATFNVSAPGVVTDFATSDGGSSQQSNDNFLKIGFTQAVQTNGFLFMIGDSSMNYISGVQTTTAGVNVTLAFGNNNSDPEVGTPYPAAVTTLGQDILIANSAGVFVSSGGTFVKKSDALDDIWNSVPLIESPTGPVYFGGGQLSAAKATIFGKRVWMVLAPVIDPFTNMQTNKLFMYNGKFWWPAHQDIGLQFITGQEINSEFIAWGTDGNGVYPLFQTPSGSMQKVIQSRLWDAPGGYDHEKSVVNVFAMAQFFGAQNLEYQLSVDNENGVPPTVQWTNAQWVNSTPQFVSWSPNLYIGTPATGVWTNSLGQSVTWANSLNQPVIWSVVGAMIAVLPPTSVGQVGAVIGFTASTYCDDMVLISMAIQPELMGYRA